MPIFKWVQKLSSTGLWQIMQFFFFILVMMEHFSSVSHCFKAAWHDLIFLVLVQDDETQIMLVHVYSQKYWHITVTKTLKNSKKVPKKKSLKLPQTLSVVERIFKASFRLSVLMFLRFLYSLLWMAIRLCHLHNNTRSCHCTHLLVCPRTHHCALHKRSMCVHAAHAHPVTHK